MKTSIKILVKLFIVCLIFFSFSLTKGIQAAMNHFDLNFILFNQNKNLSPIEIQVFNVMDFVKKEDIPYREIDIEKQEEIQNIPTNQDKGKSIYIYSTHQKEAYKDEATVLEGSKYLALLLKKLGYDVVVENRNLTNELNQKGLSYDQSYLISRSVLNDALIEHRGFDLIIDFHRDSVPRSSSYIQSNGNNYAKMMIVLGGLSSHFEKIQKNAMLLYDKTNQIENGIMKNILIREAYYNQDISENMLLIEVGSDENYYEEVKNSLEVLSKAIDEMMR